MWPRKTCIDIINVRTYQEDKCIEQEVQLTRKFLPKKLSSYPFVLIPKHKKILVLIKKYMNQFLDVKIL